MNLRALCMAELCETLSIHRYSSLLSYSTKLLSLVHIRLQGPWLFFKVISIICVLVPTMFSPSPPSFSPLPVSFVHFSLFKSMKQPLRNCSQKTGLLAVAVSLILAISFGASCLVRYWQGWLNSRRGPGTGEPDLFALLDTVGALERRNSAKQGQLQLASHLLCGKSYWLPREWVWGNHTKRQNCSCLSANGGCGLFPTEASTGSTQSPDYVPEHNKDHF